MDLAFTAEVIEWRGPSPYICARLPEAAAAEVAAVRRAASYGWGVIPVEALIGGVSFTTSLFPRDGTYLLPLKLAVRRRTSVTVGDVIAVRMRVGGRGEVRT